MLVSMRLLSGLLCAALALALDQSAIQDAKLVIGNALGHGQFLSEDPQIDPGESFLFYLYTRANPEEPQQLWVNDSAGLGKSNYNASRPTQFMTHGWLNNHLGTNCMTVKRALLGAGDSNVIVVDWARVSRLPYAASVARIDLVARQLARMIEYLAAAAEAAGGGGLAAMSLVGHSLGAHVVGLAGHRLGVVDAAGRRARLGHIVGLDPAGPMFRTPGPGLGLSREDARLVEVVHTNGGLYGLARPAGHLDFWVNGGGPGQPGCGSDPGHYCAHERAFLLYAEALGREGAGLLARRCGSLGEFASGACDANPIARFPGQAGDELQPEKDGNYYLSTGPSGPYGLGEAGASSAARD